MKLDAELKFGDRVGTTQWIVVKRLGSGTYGFVYECSHETLGSRAAVKILKPKAGVVAKLGQEKALSAARLLVRFRHPNLPEIYDARVLEGDDGLPRMWTAMELLEGEELSERLLAGPLTVEQSLRYVLQVAKPLAALDDHSGVIHRDLKPANIFITSDDVVKLLDFDTARLRGAGTVSGSGKAVGSPYYMSPESWRDHSGIDKRVDVWSLGVVLYQCLSGRLPFTASNVYKLMQVIARERPKSLAKEVGQDVWRIVARALQVDRERRWPDMHAFATAIERVREKRGWDESETMKSANALMMGATVEEQEAISRHVMASEKGLTSSPAGDWAVSSKAGEGAPNDAISMAATAPLIAAPSLAATVVLEATQSAETATSEAATSEKQTTLESASAWLEQPAESLPVELPMRPRRWRLVGGLVLAAAVGVVVIAVRWSSNSAEATEPPVTIKVVHTGPAVPTAPPEVSSATPTATAPPEVSSATPTATAAAPPLAQPTLRPQRPRPQPKPKPKRKDRFL